MTISGFLWGMGALVFTASLVIGLSVLRWVSGVLADLLEDEAHAHAPPHPGGMGLPRRIDRGIPQAVREGLGRT